VNVLLQPTYNPRDRRVTEAHLPSVDNVDRVGQGQGAWFMSESLRCEWIRTKLDDNVEPHRSE